MAATKWHVLTTSPIVVPEIFSESPLAMKIVRIIAVLFFGILIDGDHISLKAVRSGKAREHRRLLSNGIQPESGRVFYLHHWLGVVIATGVSFVLLRSSLPFLAFWFHMWIDAPNRWHRVSISEPLPRFMHPIFPEKLTYKDP